MFNFFKNKKVELTNVDDEGNLYDPDDIVVYYEGTLISPEYAAETLVFQNNGKKLREDFNSQPYPYHMLYPHGKGKMTYKDGDDVVEQDHSPAAEVRLGCGGLGERYLPPSLVREGLDRR